MRLCIDKGREAFIYLYGRRMLMKKNGADISSFIAIKSIENGVVTYANNRLARVLKVNSLNLALLDRDEQKIKINQFASILASIQWNCSIIKLERPMNLSSQIEKQKELLKTQHKKFREGNMKEDGYNNRLKQVNFEKRRLEYFNDEAHILTNEFYFIVYGRDPEEFRFLFDDIFNRFAQIK